jgi:hypothetical protein
MARDFRDFRLQSSKEGTSLVAALLYNCTACTYKRSVPDAPVYLPDQQQISSNVAVPKIDQKHPESQNHRA